MNLNELRDKRGNVNKQMTDLVAKYATTGDKWSPEDNASFARMNEDSENLRSTIDRLETVEKASAELKEVRSSLVGREVSKTVETSFSDPEKAKDSAFRSFVKYGVSNMPASEVEVLRALSIAGGGSSGAYAAPQTFTNEFVKILNNLTGIRQAPCRYFATNGGNDLPLPSFDDTANSGATTAESTGLAVNVDPAFGSKTLKAYNYDSNIVKISLQLLQDSVIPVEQLLSEALTERLSKKLNNAYTLGNGTTAPEGITVGASASGVTVPASTYGASTTAIVGNLYAIIHSVAPQYRNTPSFGLMFADSTLLYLKQLVDSTGRPIWTPGLASAEPDRLCGVPYWVNPDIAAIGTGNISMIVGDFSKFYIRDVAQVETKRFDELYAASREVGFMAWYRTDSKVVNSAAIKKVTHS